MDDILDRLPGGFLAFGDDSLIRSTNRVLRAMVGSIDHDLTGRHVESLLTVPSRIFYQTHVFPLLKMQGYLREVYLSVRTSPGNEVPVLINANRTETSDGIVNECLLIPMQRRNEYEEEILRAKRMAEDAVRQRDELNESLENAKVALERQQAELRIQNCELLSLKESLEERVKTRTKELDDLIRELQGLNYSIVHDLRAPMRAISSTSSVLIAELGESLSEEHVRLLIRQKYNAGKMASLVDDLLQLSRLVLQSLRLQPVDLSSTAKEVMLDSINRLAKAPFEVAIEDGVNVIADPELIRLAFQHLADNAVKYSPAGGVVRFGKTGDGFVSGFFVQDEGIGLDLKYSHRIFLPFQRLHLDEEYEGNGIGLAIVERVIRKHGGTIRVESALGVGSRFVFTLGGGAD